ncbi:Nif3-like dinuclear metal center hexameric protein [Spiribacter sp. C176]|uniref:Nif3-like dinuclear metal center hexameric protein n=1 Tax=Spiribacter salilacus TaxID=2664894 RepID=A0A6N7QTD2_9GAMM|nr:Nif3-like dinuclear metal center hexameric protein [Spiribacter salilacus]MRH78653.1 Nif3-like dinuclear metal center hexameric protein [Spiribacter salilacus]
MVQLTTLTDYLAEILQPETVEDYCPNGLQVEGRAAVQRLVTGVTASQRFIDAAIEAKADAILVHHGFFWKGEPAPITGMKGQRLQRLIRADVSVLAYHLPLDIHRRFGNNACLAEGLGIRVEPPLSAGGVPDLLWHGRLAAPVTPAELADRLQLHLNRLPLRIASEPKQIQHIAWCSGGGQKFLPAAAALGVQAYISGEISEPTTHEARELGVHYFAAGHHATERGGVQALGAHLAEHFGIDHQFIDDDNPA